ncbi:MAG: FAD-dependent oxidoreductase [Nocardioidaceae bacterium]
MSAVHKDADVVVAGGGIGGLSNAYVLARAGYRVRVLERSPEFAEVGAGLQMAPNATRILREWGLLDEVMEAGVLPRRLVFKDAVDGAELTHLGLGDGFVRRYGAPYVVIHRNDLLTILVRACERAGVDLVANREVDDVQTVEDHAVVFSAGEQHRADVVLAADGLRSALRAKVSDDDPICSGFVAYRGAVPTSEVIDRLGEDALRDVVVHFGPGRHLVQYPLRRGEVFNTVAVFKSPGYDRGVSDWGGPEELDEVFADSCDEVRRGLASLWRDRRWPMYDRLPITSWVCGRMALTGDAAHPMLQYLAQGACQAIEDAHCLGSQAAKHSADEGPDWQAALRDYAEVCAERTGRVQSTARTWGDIWHVDGLSRQLRNALFRDRDPADYQYVDWLYGA